MGVRIAVATLALTLACCRARARRRDRRQRDAGPHEAVTATRRRSSGADWVRHVGALAGHGAGAGRLHQHLIAALNGRIAALKARGIKVLVVVHRAPAWASGGARRRSRRRPTPATFGALHGRARRSASRRADAWELWNEPDSAEFWAGGADPGRLRGAAARRLPGDQGGPAGRRGRHRRHGRQQHGLPRRALRERRAGQLRRGRRAHRHRVPDRTGRTSTTATSAAGSAATRSRPTARSTR